MKALLVSSQQASRDLMRLAVSSAERGTGQPWRYLEAPDGVVGLEVARREQPDVVVADEYMSRAGAFSMAKDLRGAMRPFLGVIVILLDRREDEWLAKWSGADAWFVKPVDPFAMADRIIDLLGDRIIPGAVAAETKERA